MDLGRALAEMIAQSRYRLMQEALEDWQESGEKKKKEEPWVKGPEAYDPSVGIMNEIMGKAAGGQSSGSSFLNSGTPSSSGGGLRDFLFGSQGSGFNSQSFGLGDVLGFVLKRLGV